MEKTQEAQKMGEYQETALDVRKREVDFRIINVSPNVIRWKGGKQETVNARALKSLQANNSWMADF